MLTAKLLVPLGAPLQLKAGETLPPAQPKPLNTCSLTMVPPSLRSELVKVMFCAIAALEPSTLTASAAIQSMGNHRRRMTDIRPGRRVGMSALCDWRDRTAQTRGSSLRRLSAVVFR